MGQCCPALVSRASLQKKRVRGYSSQSLTPGGHLRRWSKSSDSAARIIMRPITKILNGRRLSSKSSIDQIQATNHHRSSSSPVLPLERHSSCPNSINPFPAESPTNNNAKPRSHSETTPPTPSTPPTPRASSLPSTPLGPQRSPHKSSAHQSHQQNAKNIQHLHDSYRDSHDLQNSNLQIADKRPPSKARNICELLQSLDISQKYIQSFIHQNIKLDDLTSISKVDLFNMVPNKEQRDRIEECIEKMKLALYVHQQNRLLLAKSDTILTTYSSQTDSDSQGSIHFYSDSDSESSIRVDYNGHDNGNGGISDTGSESSIRGDYNGHDNGNGGKSDTGSESSIRGDYNGHDYGNGNGGISDTGSESSIRGDYDGHDYANGRKSDTDSESSIRGDYDGRGYGNGDTATKHVGYVRTRYERQSI